MNTRLKIAIVGDGGVGKNVFFVTWMNNEFPDSYMPVIFDEYSAIVMVAGEPVSLSLCVTACQDDYDRFRPLCSYNKTDVLMVAFNVFSVSSFENVTEKWIPEITRYSPNTPWLLVGLQADLRDRPEPTNSYSGFVPKQAAIDLAKNSGAVGYYECSALTRSGLNETMEAAVRVGLTTRGKINKADVTLFKKLYQKAMSRGYVENSITKCLIIGAAGVGKTHLKHLLLEKDPPKQRISTGLADNPVRGISSNLTAINEEGNDFFVVENDEALMNIIRETIMDGDLSMKSSLKSVVSTHSKIMVKPSNVSSKDVPLRTANFKKPNKTTSQPELQSTVPDIGDKLAHHFHRVTVTPSTGKKKLFGTNVIQFIDSGGQLQYHDILPLFIQDSMVTIFVLNLSEELSHCPTIEYYGTDGKPVGKPYQSSLSHMQIIQHSLEAVHSRGTSPLIITVGTHRDTENTCTESREEKNKQLLGLLDTSHFNVLYNGEGMKEVIFAINGRFPQDEDRHVAAGLKKKIFSKSTTKRLAKIPLAWYALEIQLRMSSHDGVLSLEECLQYAGRVYIDRDAFFAALHHLVHNHLFLYYPDVLPHVVFCDPQIVLTKVSELVEYHHKLRDNPDEGVAAESCLANFRDYALVSLDLLAKFPKYYREGLFTAQDLLKLLVSLGAIGMIKEGEYLMPALLSHLDLTQISQYREVACIVVRFPRGYIPSGLFCYLVTLLLSSSWNVCMVRGKPSCLYRNCIRLQQRDTAEIMTLVDMFSYIEVHVRQPLSKVCREVKGYVHCSILSACKALNYNDVKLQDAFICTGGHCRSEPPHLAIVASREPVCKWTCTIIGDQVGDLSADQLAWFPAPTKALSSSIGLSSSATPTIRELMSISVGNLNIIQSIGTRYPDLGIFLLEDDNGVVVDALASQYQLKAADITRAIFQKWVAGEGKKPTTWKTLSDVLRCCNLASQAEAIELCFC